MSSKDLKPCPFCGSEDLVKQGGTKHYIFCSDCGAETFLFNTPDEARKRWNHRPGEEKLESQLNTLADGLIECCREHCAHWAQPGACHNCAVFAANKLAKQIKQGEKA